MPYQLCPWTWSNPFDPFPEAHMHNFRNLPSPRRMRAPRWAFPQLANGHCCELCTAYEDIPNLANSMLQLQNMLKPTLAAYLFDSYHCIHDHYKRGFDHDGPESYVLSREMQRLSSLLRDLYHETGIHELAIWSDQLKYMGRDIQIGPRRLRYNPRPTHRHNRGLLMPQMAW